jgi:hypothetical protein
MMVDSPPSNTYEADVGVDLIHKILESTNLILIAILVWRSIHELAKDSNKRRPFPVYGRYGLTELSCFGLPRRPASAVHLRQCCSAT